LAQRRLIDRIIGRSKREREQRKRRTKQFFSWLFVSMVVLVVVMLAGQFVTRVWIKPPVSSERERTDMLVHKGEMIQVNVLNGSGRPRIAQRFTDFLRARKFDVVGTANYKDTLVEHTFVIDRVNDSAASHKIAYALGIEESHIVREIDTELYVDADVVIGKDFSALKPMK
jgi:hypothetical protein